jgi:hypothetical protein
MERNIHSQMMRWCIMLNMHNKMVTGTQGNLFYKD